MDAVKSQQVNIFSKENQKFINIEASLFRFCQSRIHSLHKHETSLLGRRHHVCLPSVALAQKMPMAHGS